MKTKPDMKPAEEDLPFESEDPIFALVDVDGRKVAIMNSDILALARSRIAEADRERAARPVTVDEADLPF